MKKQNKIQKVYSANKKALNQLVLTGYDNNQTKLRNYIKSSQQNNDDSSSDSDSWISETSNNSDFCKDQKSKSSKKKDISLSNISPFS